MSSVPQVCAAVQNVLGACADTAARKTRFVQRASKMTGALFAQTLVFTWLCKPQVSLEEMAQTAAALGVRISAQGIDERFTERAARFLRAVLEEAMREIVVSEPVCIPLLSRFNGVYLLDSTTIALPDILACVWQGCGGRVEQGACAALKVQTRLDLKSGGLLFLLQDARAQDQSAPTQSLPLPAGSLRIADLGYFGVQTLARLSTQQVYWLSRVKVGTQVWIAQNQNARPLELEELGELLRHQKALRIDLPIFLGAAKRLPCRLLAVRVPDTVAQARRRKLREEAKKKGQTVSQARLSLADWTLLVTNAPDNLLSVDEALALARARWQIERLFKLWKSHGQVDECKSQKPWRVLCEVYAKLLALVVQHWLFLVCCWQYPDKSLFKAAQTVQKHALTLAASFASLPKMCAAIALLQRCLGAGCRLNKRKTRPNTYQLLLDPSYPEGFETDAKEKRRDRCEPKNNARNAQKQTQLAA